MLNLIEPINKSLDNFFKKKNIKFKPSTEDGVSIITCTNRPHSLNNILNNFKRQDFKEKELILIINNNKISYTDWKNEISSYKNIQIYKLDEGTSLGQCLNYAVKKSIYPTIARFDDDDYYGPKYLSDSMNSLITSKSGLVGKHTIFVYFIEYKNLAIKDSGYENQFLHFVNGATMIFKKDIFKKVQFKNISINEDVEFCKDCIRKRIKIYSGNKYHFVYLRSINPNKHTWKINTRNLMDSFCTLVGTFDDFKHYVDI